ncbi:hypothetical protein CGZ77_00835 [Neisseria sp. KEM232]|uniref:alpha-ketoglutarate-dependent dioxygenase AlkB n=1 Tax=Neisseria sp. KEM232 TaxID=655307 RepID=UPI000B8C0E55|nr:alpha-ketoglutarate-dependent dioxygenase AlkB [Neisseria sp. KEM232]ASP16412.1 hypothetical protein CGZ77_00835 [Neisseria sp. KEM232]
MTPAEQIQFARIAAAIEFLYDHHREQPDLAAVAAHVHLSPQHLQRQFQQWAGISPKKMLQHISIENAKRILHAQGSVQDAALASGLSGTGRLHDLFTTIEGMTPGEYKNGGAGLQIDWQLVASPYGSVLVANTGKGICFLSFADEPAAERPRLQALFPNAELRNAASQVAWYGEQNFAYTYSGATRTAQPWDSVLSDIKQQVEQQLAAVSPTCFNSCLLNRYADGSQGMAWHSDDEACLGKNTVIASVSFGATRKFAFKHKQTQEKRELMLQHGQLIVMRGSTQTHWRHAVMKSSKIQTPRINLTFRTMLPQG